MTYAGIRAPTTDDTFRRAQLVIEDSSASGRGRRSAGNPRPRGTLPAHRQWGWPGGTKLPAGRPLIQSRERDAGPAPSMLSSRCPGEVQRG